MRIVFTGGGSGGHVFPLIAIVREMRRARPDTEFFYVGPSGIGTELFVGEGIEPRFIVAGKLHRFATPAMFMEVPKFLWGIISALWTLYVLMPDAVFAKGGFGSFPVVIAAQFYFIRFYIHESDSVPGLSNRIAAFFAKVIFTAFPPPLSWSTKANVVGNPVRATLRAGNKERAMQTFRLSGVKPAVLVLGGSQGAQQINDLVLSILKDFLLIADVIHQCGTAHFEEMRAQTHVELTKDLSVFYHLVPFLNEEQMADAYAIADLVVSRAGSGNIFEIALTGKPSLLIPLIGSAQNHQRTNARMYEEAGAALVLDDPNITPHLFLAEVKNLLAAPEERARLAQNAATFSKPDAAAVIARELLG